MTSLVLRSQRSARTCWELLQGGAGKHLGTTNVAVPGAARAAADQDRRSLLHGGGGGSRPSRRDTMHGNSLSDTASRACWKRRMSSAAGDGKDKDRDPVEVLTRWSVGNGPGGRPDAALARATYWDSFYQHHVKESEKSGRPKGEFDWYMGEGPALEALSRHLKNIPEGGTVLHLGCGTSDLSVALSREAPHAKIVNADFSEECLNIMRARHPQEHWVAMDARNLPLQDGCLHAIVEKGTMDALLRGGDSAWHDMCKEALRTLRDGGQFIQITDEVPEMRQPLLEFLGQHWSVSFKELTADDGWSYFIYRCVKGERCVGR